MTTTRVDATAARAPVEVGRGRVWLGLWGGGVAWLLHFLSCWGLAEFGCLGPLARPGPLGVTWVAWLVVAATAVFLPLALAATWISWRTERAARDAEALAFAARVGWISGALFSVVVLAEAAPILYFLRGCGDVGVP